MKIVVLPKTSPGKLIIATHGDGEVVVENKIQAAKVLSKILDAFFAEPEAEAGESPQNQQEEPVLWNDPEAASIDNFIETLNKTT